MIMAVKRALPLFFLTLSVALANPLSLRGIEERLPLGMHVDILEDPSGSLQFSDIQTLAKKPVLEPTGKKKTADVLRELRGKGEQAFVKSNMPRPSFGFSSSAYWLRFKLHNQVDPNRMTTRVWLLEAGYPSLDYIWFFYPDRQGSYHKVTGGDKYIFKERQFNYKNVVFRLPDFEGEKEFFIRVQTSGTADLPFSLQTNLSFTNKVVNEQYGYGLYFGIMLVMVLYNLFIYLSTRDAGYLHYVAFIVCNSLFQMNLRGYAFQYLWPESIWWGHQSAPFFLGLFAVFGFQFTRHFLNTRETAPLLDRIILVLMVLELGISVGALAGLGHEITSRAMVIGGALFVLVAGATGYRTFLKGYRPARFFNIAFTVYFVGGVVQVLSRSEILPFNFFTEQADQIGFAIQVILLSLGLADRINIMKKEKEEAQAELLESRRIMLDSFARFVPKQFLNFLGHESIVDVGLGDAVQKNFTVLFTDIRGFTTLSESMTAEENFRFLNSYLRKMGPLIHSNHGFIDKFIGDAIMALFPESAADALQASIDMRRALYPFNQSRIQQGFDPITMGIGLHSGNLMLGTVGSEDRLDTTVIGDTVNLASRLESMTKTFKISILLSDSVRALLPDHHHFRLREIDTVRVKGRTNPVVVYEAYDGDPEALLLDKEKSLKSYQEALGYYKIGKFDHALSIFQELSREFPEDNVPQMYVRRCIKLKENPPGPGWRGISRMVMK